MRGFWFKQFRHSSSFQQLHKNNRVGTSLCCHRSLERGRCRQQHDKANNTHSRALQKHLSGYVDSYWSIESMQRCLPESLKKRTSKCSETLSFLTSALIGVLTKESTLDLQLESVVKPIIFWVNQTQLYFFFFFFFMSLFIFLQVLIIVKYISVNTQLHSPTSLRPITDEPSEQFNSK